LTNAAWPGASSEESDGHASTPRARSTSTRGAIRFSNEYPNAPGHAAAAAAVSPQRACK
jgi:hypothetical protein